MKLAMHRLLHFMELVICVSFVIHMCAEFPRMDCRFDYQGILVGIIAALITLVIAWDIYQGIGFDKAKDEVLKLKKDLDRSANYCNNRIDYFNALNYAIRSSSIAIIFIKNNESIQKCEMLSYGLLAIKHLSFLPDCEAEICPIVGILIESLNQTRDICIPPKSKKEFILMCGEIQHREKIEKFEELFSLIENIKTN